MSWKCSFCGLFSALSIYLLLTHINTKHLAEDEDFHAKCGIDGCVMEFRKANTLVRHIRTNHRLHLYVDSTKDFETGNWCIRENSCLSSQSESFSETGSDVPNQFDQEVAKESVVLHREVEIINQCGDYNQSLANNDQSVQDKAAKFLLKVKEENRLGQATVQKISEATSKLFKGTLRILKRKLENSLETAFNVEIKDIPGFEESFEEIEDPFDDLRTGWLQTEYVKKHLPFVEPQKKVLGTRLVFAKRNNKKRIVETEDVFYYIPILETIGMQLSTSRRLLEMILNAHSREFYADKPSCVLGDFSDGSVIKNHPIFATDEYALRVLIYYDDINVVNHMTNKIHKLGLFYYQLANIEPKYRSKTKSIHLFAICKNEYIKKYGMNNFLKPMVDDMKCLGQEEGYRFSICGGKLNLRGAILAVLADTPASQAVGGFKESVGGARRKCRHCMANFESMQEFFTEDDFICRDRELHEIQLNDLEKTESKFLKKFFSKNYGINTRSALLDAPHFDVTNQLPQDLMHVFLEGIITYELKFLLLHYIHTGEITLVDLNSKIQKFSYGYSEVKDKPAEIKQSDLENSASTNLGQSAAQMWELTCILPFVLESSIKDIKSCYWRCFLSLLEIMSLCFARQISASSIIYLKGLISEHLKQFKEIYGANIIPKQHYLVHIPSQMMMFGPLISTWCMRFEAKHSFFKDIARKVKNFKNLPLTLAMRHQSMESADTINLDGVSDPCPLFKDDFHCAKKNQLTGGQYAYAKSQLKRFYDTIDNNNIKVWECQSITVHGTFYKPGNNNYLLIRITDDSLPEFGRLSKIWYASSYGPFFVLTVMETKTFSQHLNAFQVTECAQAQGYEVIRHLDLFDFKVLHAYRSRSEKYIVLKGNVLSV